ncbi:carbonic anhydrase [Pseudothauera nasutitermitis]|uniref:carbonic anhydrase n=1 Tax=Pseudothauera nasutitermitis TaxID=2565930 RepID=A0A4S4ATP1_9RHOO|nr:surface-adhesin E family protein [Pseudothauera nasutitermitis]THF61941.1 carbonic anhydrase [Pseudothauera nasutitermitis]
MTSQRFPALRRTTFLLLLAGAVQAPPALADDWAVVMRDRDRRVEIDRSTIIQSDGGTKVAWGRLVASAEEAAKIGYTTVKALNRYDCNNRGFQTVRRVYLDSENRILREETVVDQSLVMVARNSVDERMWREVCRPPTMGDLAQVAAQADRAVAAATANPPAAGRAHAAANPAGGVQVRPASVQESGGGADVIERAILARAEPAAAAPAPVPATSAAPPAPARSGASAAPRASAAPAARSAPASPSAQPAAQAERAATPTMLTVESGWSYDGATGPETWGRLRADWSACAEGHRQSPIDLRDGIAVDLEPVRFDFRQTRFRVAGTRNNLVVRVGDGMGMEVRGERYELESLQFHRPSEILVDGRASDMAAHFHLRAADGRRAVLAVPLERGEQANPVLQAVLNNLPLERGEHYMPAESIDLSALLPESPAHYLFMGSLSQPPCTEGVLWVVMKQSLPLSGEQLTIFSRLYERNARPVQPANDRMLLESRH